MDTLSIGIETKLGHHIAVNRLMQEERTPTMTAEASTLSMPHTLMFHRVSTFGPTIMLPQPSGARDAVDPFDPSILFLSRTWVLPLAITLGSVTMLPFTMGAGWAVMADLIIAADQAAMLRSPAAGTTV
jgi:hypothetical protein